MIEAQKLASSHRISASIAASRIQFPVIMLAYASKRANIMTSAHPEQKAPPAAIAERRDRLGVGGDADRVSTPAMRGEGTVSSVAGRERSAPGVRARRSRADSAHGGANAGGATQLSANKADATSSITPTEAAQSPPRRGTGTVSISYAYG